uniref:BBS2 hairpin domain-containing protein n=1 Tax=Strombidium rassoulzadegani TaxID=1082188 RepID=A0A7S3CS79_9SPIT|mmetsp:Transcript_5822/g.9958  ORF Transcript_5822/g.9958 Transcript_5822/m.9958 type:complete len:213 (+) Transcript_5822:791-1429(+)
MKDAILRKANNFFMQIKALDLRSGRVFSLSLQNDEQNNQAFLQMQCEDIETASDLIQDLLGDFLKVREFESEAKFPHLMEKLNNELLVQIQESNQLKGHFAANISESIQNLKVSVVKAEASLIINDVTTMRKHYAIVQQENGQLIGEYIKRSNNHQELVHTLKELNNLIRFASNLRIGSCQKLVVQQARECIRKQTTEKIQAIFERGRLQSN